MNEFASKMTILPFSTINMNARVQKYPQLNFANFRLLDHCALYNFSHLDLGGQNFLVFVPPGPTFLISFALFLILFGLHYL